MRLILDLKRVLIRVDLPRPLSPRERERERNSDEIPPQHQYTYLIALGTLTCNGHGNNRHISQYINCFLE